MQGNTETAKLKQAIEAQYVSLCTRIEAATDTDNDDPSLREDIAELAAMMIAYAHQTGGKHALEAALANADKTNRSSSTARLSLAERARTMIAERRDH